MAQMIGTASQSDWQSLWSTARERLRSELGDALFDAWIASLVLVSAQKDEIELGAPKPFARNWVANRYADRIERAFQTAGRSPASLSIVLTPKAIGAQADRATRADAMPVEGTAGQSPASQGLGSQGLGSQGLGSQAPANHVPDSRGDAGPRRTLANRLLHPSQTFDTFVPGPANEFAYRAAKALADGEASEIGLLYVHGGFGFGKTHLLNATALEAKKRGRRPLFLGAEDFMRQFLGALHRKDTLSFKEELRGADILLIDDLQHICRSSATISEFLHTVNAFADQRRRVVIAADKPPAALDNLGEDVRSRLSGGLVIGLARPERDTRLAILKAKAAEFVRLRPSAVLPQDVLERIADIDGASPRDLIGLFTKLATYADLTKKPVTLDVVEETLGQQRVSSTHKTSIDDIQRKTAEFYKLDMRDFHSPQRTRRVARPRQVAMYLARELTQRSLPEIGKRFGGRDHTTVLHACRRVAALCDEDSVFRQEVDFLKQVLSRRTDL